MSLARRGATGSVIVQTGELCNRPLQDISVAGESSLKVGFGVALARICGKT